jgi:hypothetical protein
MKEIILTLILIFLILYFVYINLYTDDNLIYEKATFDNNYYWVRNMADKSQAANTLALIKSNMIKLIDYLQKNIDQFPENASSIKDLVKRTRKIYIMETPKDEKFTSYTINKGEKIVFCLRSKVLHNIHDINTIMYVVLHELSHVCTSSYGHTPEFKENFKFLLVQANKIGIYKITNYRRDPVSYCGMEINEYLLDNVKLD